eukprot:8342815-Prorocentrum_lima.AAC.1
MVDCLGTVQAQRGQPEHQLHADWWQEVQRSWGPEPALTKVKAHISAGQVKAGSHPAWHKQGNGIADGLAKKGAK